MSKKIQIILFIVAVFFSVSAYATGGKTGYWQSVFNNFKEGFYFEKFDTADAAFEEIRQEKIAEAQMKNPGDPWDYRWMSDYYKKRIDIRRDFRDYKADITTELLKLHPIGSDVNGPIKTLEKAGADCYFYASDSSKERLAEIPKNGRVRCYYKEAGIIFPTDWRIFIEVDESKVHIKRISGVVYFTPL